MDISIPGNVPTGACNIYKVKGNKRISYKMGKMFGYNNDGKYQLKNQYTLQYGDYYFYFQKQGKKILFKDTFDTDPSEISNYSFNLTYGEDKYGTYILLNPHNGNKGVDGEYLTRVINIFDKHFDEWKLEKKIDTIEGGNDFIRDVLDASNTIQGKWDNDFYAQKFNLPDDMLLKIATEEGIKSELLDKMKGDLEKNNYLFCNLAGPSGNVCKGDFDAKPTMTLDEENELLQKQATQIKNMMSRFDNIPRSHFTKFPENEELFKFMKNTINTIETASKFVYKRVKDVNWVVKTQLDTNAEAKKLTGNTNKKFSSPSISGQVTMGDLVDENSIMANALKDMTINLGSQQIDNRTCRSLEGFESGGAPGPSSSNVLDLNKNISGKYYEYVKSEIDKKKSTISELNDKIHGLLAQMNKMSDGMDLSGEKKQMLLSEMIKDKNNLEKHIFDIKNYEQADRIDRIGDKLKEVEDIRKEMEEDDFITKKPSDDANNVSIISKEDGELFNMYKINKNNTPDHLLFINGGCLQYDSDKKDLKVEHCEANVLEQQFNVYRIEDKTDMDKYNLKNSGKGLSKPTEIVMTKDKKCLHKENGEISVRNCNNITNQYWDYSNITGPCNLDK